MPNDPDIAILDAARRAFENIPLYSRVYRKRPERLAEVPFLTPNDFAAAGGLSGCTTDLDLIIGHLPPWRPYHRRFPYNIVEDEADQERRQQRFRRAMAGLNMAPRSTLAIVAEESTGPLAAELAKQFGWEFCQASIAFHQSSVETTADLALAFAPDRIVLASEACFGHDAFRASGVELLGIDHVDANRRPSQAIPCLLWCDEIGILGWRSEETTNWRYDPTQLAFEADETTGLWAVSTLTATCQPFIRYRLQLPVDRHDFLPEET